MTASAVARRNGVAATGPPSWKTSSTTMTRLRSCTSGMQETPLGKCDESARDAGVIREIHGVGNYRCGGIGGSGGIGENSYGVCDAEGKAAAAPAAGGNPANGISRQNFERAKEGGPIRPLDH